MKIRMFMASVFRRGCKDKCVVVCAKMRENLTEALCFYTLLGFAARKRTIAHYALVHPGKSCSPCVETAYKCCHWKLREDVSPMEHTNKWSYSEPASSQRVRPLLKRVAALISGATRLWASRTDTGNISTARR